MRFRTDAGVVRFAFVVSHRLLIISSKENVVGLAALVEHIPGHAVADIHDGLETLARLVVVQHLLLAVLPEVLLLDLDQLVEMVLQLLSFQLFEVVLAQNHVLDELSDLLVEFDHVRLLVDEILDLLPVLEHVVRVGFLGPSSEAAHQLA